MIAVPSKPMEFFSKIQIAITHDRLDLVREAFLLRQTGMLSDKWGIYINKMTKGMSFDIELLERVVRFMVTFHYLFSNDPITFTIECDKELAPYVEWFVRFFTYLEGSENWRSKDRVPLGSNHKEVFTSTFIAYPFYYEDLYFVEDKIQINFI